MPLMVKQTGGGAPIEPVEPGVYVAVAYAVIDLGCHYSSKFDKEERKVLIIWELPEVRGDFERDGQMQNLPRAISARFTVSLHEKANLRRALESWRGRKFTDEELRGFDLQKLLGKACQLQIVTARSSDGQRTYSSVASIMGLPRGLTPPPAENPLAFFSFDDCPPDRLPDLPENLPEWVREVIAESREWKERTARAGQPPAAPAPRNTGSAAPAAPPVRSSIGDDDGDGEIPF